MGMNADRRASCDRCGRQLSGFGVLQGLVCTYMDAAGDEVNLIFCYETCRNILLTGKIVSTVFGVCATCSLPVPNISEGMLCTDLNPNGSGLSRSIRFCRFGHQDQILQAVS